MESLRPKNLLDQVRGTIRVKHCTWALLCCSEFNIRGMKDNFVMLDYWERLVEMM